MGENDSHRGRSWPEHTANHLQESLPGLVYIKQDISNSELHTLSLTHHLLFICYLRKRDHLHGHASQNCCSHPQHPLPFIWYVNNSPQFHLLDMPSSFSGNILVQALIISFLCSATNSIFVSLQFILHIFVTSLKYGFESITLLHKNLNISHCPLSKLLSLAPAYLSSSFFHHLSVFPRYTE